MNLRLRLIIEWIAIGLAVSLLILVLAFRQSTSSFDNLIYDRLQAAAPAHANSKILLVAIDEPSLQALGRWPWDRSLHAKLINRLHKAGARSITFDIILSETGDANADAELAKALAGPSPTFIPLHFNTPGTNGHDNDLVLPAPIFGNAAKGIGQVNVNFDTDGVVRRTILCFRPNDGEPGIPHLMEQLYRNISGHAHASAAFQKQKCGNEIMFPFARRGSFSEISYVDLLAGNLPEKFLQGRDVFIGATAAGLGDNFPTPNGDGGLLPGIEVMANMLGALRENSFIKPLNNWQVALISILPLFLLMAGFLRWRPGVILGVSLTLIAVILLTSIAMLHAKYWFPPGAALIGVIAVYPLWGWRRLQAVSDFLGNELGELQREDEIAAIPLHRRQEGDLVGRQSAALAEAIDHIRDLRRFITDTMHDLPDPMVVTDLEGKVTLESDQVRLRMGHSTMGEHLDNLLQQIVLPEHKLTLHEYLQHHGGQSEISTNGPDFVRFVTSTGSTFALRKTPLQSADGTLQGHVHYFADITALAQAQLEREQALQLLSHDMRAPQSAIIAALSGKLDSEARDRIERNARRTMQLAQDFVDMARMEDSEFSGEDVLLIELLRDAADNLWPLAKEKTVKIELVDNSDAGFVIAEPDSLSRAFANLLDNAIKYSPNGGTIQIEITKTNDNDRRDLCVKISDDGPGIAKEMLPKLFARFASTGEKRGRTQGMGLGLSFVATIVRRHGGEVHGKNLPEGGSCFVITLPEADEPKDDLPVE